MYKLILRLNKYRMIVLLSLISLFQVVPANADECLQALPVNAIKDGIPRVCQSNFTGVKLDYVCQDYRANGQHYQILYKGGVNAKAILQIDTHSKQQVQSVLMKGVACSIPAPSGIPAHALHRGIGLCLDQNDDTVPCSIYEHAEARQPVQYRNFVFYKTDNKGDEKITIQTMSIQSNKDAMSAELSYQIGISLSKTECCAEQAIEYLAYAYKLFPHADLYREAYQLSLNTIADSNIN